jgi:hypothetical protein
MGFEPKTPTKRSALRRTLTPTRPHKSLQINSYTYLD